MTPPISLQAPTALPTETATTPPQQPHPPTSTLESGEAPAYLEDLLSFLTAAYYPEEMAPAYLLTSQMDDQLPPDACKCPMSIRLLIRRAHRNLGHPSKPSLVRLLRTARCPQVALDHAKRMICPTCIRRKPPQRIPRATMPYRPARSNHTVGLYLKCVRIPKVRSFLFWLS